MFLTTLQILLDPVNLIIIDPGTAGLDGAALALFQNYDCFTHNTPRQLRYSYDTSCLKRPQPGKTGKGMNKDIIIGKNSSANPCDMWTKMVQYIVDFYGLDALPKLIEMERKPWQKSIS